VDQEFLTEMQAHSLKCKPRNECSRDGNRVELMRQFGHD
jgi:hypothetical protein